MVNWMLTRDNKEQGASTAGTSTGSVLIPRELYDTLIGAVRKTLVFRPLAAMIIGPGSIPGSSVDVPLQSEDTMTVMEIAEGAEIPMDVEGYESFNMKPVKYGVRIAITREMIEDSLYDVMRYNTETAGYELANKEDELIVAQLNAGSTASGHDVSNSNATIAITDITEAMQNLETDNYQPTHIIVGAEVANDLRNIDTFVEADKAGINDPSKSLIGRIFAMNVLRSNQVSAKLAYVIDANHAFVIAEKRPITLRGFDQWERDIQNVVATMRIKIRYLRSKAISEITTT